MIPHTVIAEPVITAPECDYDRMVTGVLVLSRTIDILKNLGNFTDEEIAASVATAKREIADEFPEEQST